MTPVREAFALPLVFLTVVLLGGIRLTAPVAIAPPTLFSLVQGFGPGRTRIEIYH